MCHQLDIFWPFRYVKMHKLPNQSIYGTEEDGAKGARRKRENLWINCAIRWCCCRCCYFLFLFFHSRLFILFFILYVFVCMVDAHTYAETLTRTLLSRISIFPGSTLSIFAASCITTDFGIRSHSQGKGKKKRITFCRRKVHVWIERVVMCIVLVRTPVLSHRTNEWKNERNETNDRTNKIKRNHQKEKKQHQRKKKRRNETEVD